MRTFRTILVALTALLSVLVAAPASADKDHWRGSEHARPSTYKWVGQLGDGYEVLIVRGLNVRQVRRTLGVVKSQLRDMGPYDAMSWTDAHTDWEKYTAPRMAQVHRRGRSVVVYLPLWIMSTTTIQQLSRKGTVVDFFTSVEDQYVTVARRGKIIRSFDALLGPNGDDDGRPLPEEKGLPWGKPRQDAWATTWAFMERVSRIHLSKTWFLGDHPTWVFRGRAP